VKRYRLAGVAALVAVILAAPRGGAATPVPPPSGWAVLIEFDSYRGRYPDLAVGYVNSRRMLDALMHRGWPQDHVLLIRDSLDGGVLPRATVWLAERVRPGDTALLYVSGEYQFFVGDLSWNTVFAGLWRQIMTSHRVLIVETCFAQRLTAAAGGTPGLGLPAVGRDELDWWGRHDTGHVIEGGSFTHFLARAVESQPAGALDFAEAFDTAVAGAQEYFHTVVAAMPAALNSFHARGGYPERLSTFPNPRLVRGTENATADR